MATFADLGKMNGYGGPQQMMAQKLMEATPAPVANSSQESAAANTLSQGFKGAMQPQWDSATQSYKSPEWMDWIGKQFGSGTPAAGGFDASGFGAGMGAPTTWAGF